MAKRALSPPPGMLPLHYSTVQIYAENHWHPTLRVLEMRRRSSIRARIPRRSNTP